MVNNTERIEAPPRSWLSSLLVLMTSTTVLLLWKNQTASNSPALPTPATPPQYPINSVLASNLMFPVSMAPKLRGGFLRSPSFSPITRRQRRNASPLLRSISTVPHYHGISGCTKMVRSVHGINSFKHWNLALLQLHMITLEVICLSSPKLLVLLLI